MIKIIVLDDGPNASASSMRIALYADVPASRQRFYALQQATKTSACIDADALEPTLNAKLASGQMTEKVMTFDWPANTTSATKRAEVVKTQALFQAEVNARNPWANYGTRWDDATGWVAGSVA